MDDYDSLSKVRQLLKLIGRQTDDGDLVARSSDHLVGRPTPREKHRRRSFLQDLRVVLRGSPVETHCIRLPLGPHSQSTIYFACPSPTLREVRLGQRHPERSHSQNPLEKSLSPTPGPSSLPQVGERTDSTQQASH